MQMAWPATEPMSATPSQITSIFAADPVHGLRGGEGWTLDSVRRDIATIHHLVSRAFRCTLDSAIERDGRGFCAHIIFVRSGELGVVQWGHRRTLSGGDIFVACAWLPITFEGSDDLDLLIITLPGWWSMQRFMDQFQILPDLHVGKTYFAAPIIADLARSLFGLTDGDDVAASQGLHMIADLMRTALAACAARDKAMPRAQGRMGAILWFMARNLEKPGLSAQDAAASLRCSVRTIYKTCAIYGASFSTLLIEIRLVAAQYQLMRTDEQVSQIAYGVGFSSLSHFSRLFRARFGIPAKTMRRARVAQSPH